MAELGNCAEVYDYFMEIQIQKDEFFARADSMAVSTANMNDRREKLRAEYAQGLKAWKAGDYFDSGKNAAYWHDTLYDVTMRDF